MKFRHVLLHYSCSDDKFSGRRDFLIDAENDLRRRPRGVSGCGRSSRGRTIPGRGGGDCFSEDTTSSTSTLLSSSSPIIWGEWSGGHWIGIDLNIGLSRRLSLIGAAMTEKGMVARRWGNGEGGNGEGFRRWGRRRGGEEIKCWMVLGRFDLSVDSTFGGSVWPTVLGRSRKWGDKLDKVAIWV